MASLRNDFVYTLRNLIRSPGFAMMAVLALALGIGANTSMFAVLDSILLRPYPYRGADRIVRVYQTQAQRNVFESDVSLPDFLDFRDQVPGFSSMAAVSSSSLLLSTPSGPQVIRGARVSPGLFDVLGARPVLGRLLLPAEEKGDGARVAVISHDLWQRQFGADPHVIGRVLRVQGQPHEVVGVLESFSEFPDDTEMWLPLAADAGRALRQERNLVVLGRLANGARLESAGAQLATAARRLSQEHPDTNKGWSAQAMTLKESRTGRYSSLLAILVGVVAFVLLLACANVANLLLQRAVVRESEVSLRLALGAGRGYVVRLLLLESLVLAVLGGLAGLAFAQSLLELIQHSIPFRLPAYIRFELTPEVLLFTLGLSVLAALLIGVVSAVRLTRQSARNVLSGIRSGGSARSQRLRNGLVVMQVALALTLLVGATLMTRSFQRLQSIDPGFDQRHGVLTFRVMLPQESYPRPAQRDTFYRSLIERLQGLPGVRAVAVDSHVPLGGAFLSRIQVEGAETVQPEARPVGGVHLTGGNYLQAIGLPLLQGHTLSAADGAEAPRVALISQQMAQQLWPGESPLGKRFHLDFTRDNTWWTVVGVTRDVHYEIGRPPGLNVYIPYIQLPRGDLNFLVRTAADPLALVKQVTAQVRTLDPELTIDQVHTLRELVETSLWYQRLSSRLLGIFAGLALVLAVVGIYSATSYSVAQRTREIGIRMALGAQVRDALRLVVGEGVRLALLGVVIGVVAAFALTRLLRSFLFQVSSTDPGSFVGVALVLVAIAALASYLPARRASGDLGPDLRVPVAVMAGAGRSTHRPDIGARRPDQEESRFAAPDRIGVECRRHSADEAAALPRLLPVLRGGRQAVVPALSAQRRCFPRRSVQYRFVRAVDPPGRAANGPRTRRLRLDRRRLPSLPQPPRAGRAATRTHASSAAEAGAATKAAVAIRLPVRRYRDRRLPV